jgi:serine/threonine protein phosphatase PrpC
MEDQQAVNFVLKYRNDKANISKHLLHEALQTRGTTDNGTVVYDGLVVANTIQCGTSYHSTRDDRIHNRLVQAKHRLLTTTKPSVGRFGNT